MDFLIANTIIFFNLVLMLNLALPMRRTECQLKGGCFFSLAKICVASSEMLGTSSKDNAEFHTTDECQVMSLFKQENLDCSCKTKRRWGWPK